MLHALFLTLLVQPCLSVGGKGTEPPSDVNTTTASTKTNSITASTRSPSPSDDQIGADMNCTVTNTAGTRVYSESATGCFNIWEDLRCKVMYGDGNADGAQAGEHNKRPSKCYLDSNGAYNSTRKQTAKAQCAHFCGYCCELSQFNCTNNPKNGIDCAAFTKKDCFDPTQKKSLIENCPNVCGFCNLPPCEDLSPDCAYWDNNSGYCTSIDYTEAEKRRDCAATCNLC